MKKTGFEHVREFHETFNHPINTSPCVPEAKIVKLRLALILEEFTELAEACVGDTAGGQNLLKPLAQAMDAVKALEEDDLNVDVVEVADALTDINYVTYGAGHCFGVDLDACMQEVQRANMSKLGEDGKPIYNAQGKVMKGPNYTPPDIASVLGLKEEA
jgi:predicted HAD superfamily Cof-like phosphohydrolase